MQDVNGVVIDINSVSGNSNGRAWTRFDVMYSDGKTYGTFDAALAGTATQLKGQPSSLRGDTRTNNRGFTNNNLVAIAPEGELPPMPENTGGNNSSPQIAMHNPHASSDPRQKSIHRQVAFKGAIEIIATGNAPIESLKELVDKYEKIINNDEPPQPQPDPEDKAATPEEVAATVPNTQVGEYKSW